MHNYPYEIKLVETYGCLLSEKKFEYVKHYFYDDLSYAEIAEIFRISRASVAEAIKNSINEMMEYEQKLQLIKKREERINFIKIYIKDEKIIEKYLKLEYEGEK